MGELRDRLMSEITFLLDRAEGEFDPVLRLMFCAAAQQRINAVKAIDRMNEAFERYYLARDAAEAR